MSEVTSADIEQMVRDIAAGKTAKDEKIGPRRRIIVRGGDGAGRKVVRDVSALFTFAIRNGYRSDNPVENAAVNKVDQQRTHFLTLEKFQQLGLALDELEAEGIINRKAIDITRLWAMTGCRRDEIAALKWCEVDFEQCCLVLEKRRLVGRSGRLPPRHSCCFHRYLDIRIAHLCSPPHLAMGITKVRSACGRKSSKRPSCRD
ncbi:hypothetical protein LZK80_24090 [Rhizobium leguminosarum]|nr:hypothetical protein LZK80_24090 [Rhizobium leguminosarum]